MALSHAAEEFLETVSPELDLPFSPDEYTDRARRFRESMVEAGAAFAYLTSPESIYYLTGFHSSWYQAGAPPLRLPLSGVGISSDDDEIFLTVHGDEMLLAEMTTSVTDIRRLDPADPVADLVAQLRAVGWTPGTAGLELSSYRPVPAVGNQLVEALAQASVDVIDVTQTMRAVQRVKSPQELAYHRTGGAIGDRAMASLKAVLRPGMTEMEVYGELVHAVGEAGGETPSINGALFAGTKAAMLHNFPSRRRIVQGDSISIDIAGVFHRYHADMGRSLFIGEPPAGVADRVDASAGGFKVFQETARVGSPVAETLDRLREYYAEVGLLDDVWWIGGYELPASFPPDWVGNWSYDSLYPTEEKVFPQGLVTNYESNFYLPVLKGVSLIVDTFIFADEEPELLHKSPLGLTIVD